MKASRLQAYWKKICDDEKRAKQRNEMLIREFERIDAHMAEMNARTQRLALMKVFTSIIFFSEIFILMISILISYANSCFCDLAEKSQKKSKSFVTYEAKSLKF